MHREQCAWLAGRFSETLVADPASNQKYSYLAPATGFHSGTKLLEGFKRFSQEPPKDLLSGEWSSESARAEKALLLDRKIRSVACSERAPEIKEAPRMCINSGNPVRAVG